MKIVILSLLVSGLIFLSDNIVNTALADKPRAVNNELTTIYPADDELNNIALSWLKYLDNKAYQAGWFSTALIFQQHISLEKWDIQLKRHRQPLGEIIGRMFLGITKTNTITGAPDGVYAIAQYRSQFEYKNSSIETITLILDEDKTWRVSGYFIR